MRNVFTILLICLSITPALCSPAAPKQAGTFDLFIHDGKIGTEQFSRSPSRQSIQVSVMLGGANVSEKLAVLTNNNKITSIHLTAVPGGSASLNVTGNTADVVFSAVKGMKRTIKWNPEPVLFGNYMPSLLSDMIARYPLKPGQTKKITLLQVDVMQALSGELRRGKTFAFQVTSHKEQLTHYVLTLAGALGNVDLQILANSSHQVLSWRVVSQGYTAILKGCEKLLSYWNPQTGMASMPVYKVTKLKKIMMPMRDGIQLAASIYLPDAKGKFPVILERTPYGRHNLLDAYYYASRGYAVVTQDVRGRYGSQGDWQPFLNEANDGADSVAWCASQPWSDGKVGMIGASYGGYVQWAAAQQDVGALRCIVPEVSPPMPLYNVPYSFGELFLLPDLWWSAIANGRYNGAIPVLKNLTPFFTLPLSQTDQAVLGKTIPFYQYWLSHSPSSKVWQTANFNAAMKTMKPLPALMISGWFDGDGIGTELNYQRMVAAGQKNQYLLIGPWAHEFNSSTSIGGIQFGSKAVINLQTILLQWFDHWLKGMHNNLRARKKAEVFLMGLNKWEGFNQWPPARSVPHKFYLEPNGGLGSRQISSNKMSDNITYDPMHPYIPAADRSLFLTAQNKPNRNVIPPKNSFLTFTTQPLKKNLLVAGPLFVHLWAASSAPDTDYVAWLQDVQPNGTAVTLAIGIVRALYRHGFLHPAPLQPGKPVLYSINLWGTGYRFAKGHRIKLKIASSYFPTFARNLNTLQPSASAVQGVIAHQSIFRSPSHPSYLTLPVVSPQHLPASNVP